MQAFRGLLLRDKPRASKGEHLENTGEHTGRSYTGRLAVLGVQRFEYFRLRDTMKKVRGDSQAKVIMPVA
jgi:hypothetical protein